MLENHLAIAKVRRVVSWSAVILFFVLQGCCKPFNSSTKQENEDARAWVTGSWTGQYDWTPIARSKTVSESKISRAATLLQATAVLRITAAEAQELVGESGPPIEKEAPYLLRGVGDINGTFPVEPAVRPDGTVWVGGGANSKCAVPMRRRPLVAWLDRMPEKVYVTFYVNRD